MTHAHTASRWLDSPRRYGLISRLLHWGMAALFAWQFAGMILKVTLGLSPRDSFIIGTHNSVGAILLALVLVRALWALINWRNRPAHPPTLLGKLATLGHLGLYALMIYVPAVALLRLYGSGRAFSLFGVLPVWSAGGDPVKWMIAPAALTHGKLGWTLLALIAGHMIMVAVHHFIWKDDTLHKMAGPRLR